MVEAEAEGERTDWFEVLWPSRIRPAVATVRDRILAAFPGASRELSVEEFEEARRAAVSGVEVRDGCRR